MVGDLILAERSVSCALPSTHTQAILRNDELLSHHNLDSVRVTLDYVGGSPAFGQHRPANQKLPLDPHTAGASNIAENSPLANIDTTEHRTRARMAFVKYPG